MITLELYNLPKDASPELLKLRERVTKAFAPCTVVSAEPDRDSVVYKMIAPEPKNRRIKPSNHIPTGVDVRAHGGRCWYGYRVEEMVRCTCKKDKPDAGNLQASGHKTTCKAQAVIREARTI